MTEYYTPRFVESFPATMEHGVLYVSTEYNTCGHLCACGCGAEVVTPLSPAQWMFSYDGRDVTLWPSVGSWALPCRSHYYIDRGQVEWSWQYSDEQIARNRIRDRAALNKMDQLHVPETAATDDGADRHSVDAGLPLRRGSIWNQFCRVLRARS